MEKKDKCCTPKGQVPRYVDCIGCDKKPIETMSKQTAVEWLEDQLRQHYLLLDCEYILKKAKKMEKEQIKDAAKKSCLDWGADKYSEQYYNETYGGAEWQAKQMYSKDELADLIDATFQGRQDVADLFSELLKNLKTK